MIKHPAGKTGVFPKENNRSVTWLANGCVWRRNDGGGGGGGSQNQTHHDVIPLSYLASSHQTTTPTADQPTKTSLTPFSRGGWVGWVGGGGGGGRQAGR